MSDGGHDHDYVTLEEGSDLHAQYEGLWAIVRLMAARLGMTAEFEREYEKARWINSDSDEVDTSM